MLRMSSTLFLSVVAFTKLVAAIHSVNVAIYLAAIDDGQRCTVSFAAEAAVPG